MESYDWLFLAGMLCLIVGVSLGLMRFAFKLLDYARTRQEDRRWDYTGLRALLNERIREISASEDFPGLSDDEQFELHSFLYDMKQAR